MGSHIFRILGVRKLGYCRDIKIENVHHIKFNKCVSSFKGFITKVDA